MALTFEQKKEKQADVFQNVNQKAEQQNAEQVYKLGKVQIDEDFIRQQSSLQEEIYSAYEEKWGRKSQGHLVEKPSYHPEDIEIKNQNLSYRQRYKRREQGSKNIDRFNMKMGMMDSTLKAVTGSDENSPLAFINATNKVGTYSYDMMSSTVRLAAIEVKKAEIEKNLSEVAKNVDPLYTKYKDKLMALAPPLEAEENDNLETKVNITQKSIDAYRDFMKKAMEDPVEVLKDAVTDTLYSIGLIPEKLLEKNAIPQKIDVLKQLKDRYKTVANLFDNAGISDVYPRSIAA